MKIAVNNDRIDIILSSGDVYSITKENYVGAYEYMLTHATANEIESARKWLGTLQQSFDRALQEIEQTFSDVEAIPEEEALQILDEVFKDF